MDLLEGESLRAVLRARGTLDPAACARLFLPIVDARACRAVGPACARADRRPHASLHDDTRSLEGEMRSRATQALVCALLTAVACAPAPFLALIYAYRATAIAKQLGVRPPTRAYTATAIACVLAALWVAFMALGFGIERRARFERESRIEHLRTSTAAAAAKDGSAACGPTPH